jgi:hypothetical protein
MEGWRSAGVRTERVIVDGRAFDAPLVVMESGEILPMIVRFPEADPGARSAVPDVLKHGEAAEALIDTTHLVLDVLHACRKVKVERADEIVSLGLELVADAMQLYRAGRRDDEVQRLCALVARQMRMGLLALQVRRAVLQALKARNPHVVYRRFTRIPETDGKGGALTDGSGRKKFVTECSREYRRGRVKKPRGGHVYEIVQGAMVASMPSLHVDEDALSPIEEEGGDATEFVSIPSAPDSLEELCIGHLPGGEDVDAEVAECSVVACYADEPHVCCALPPVDRPSAVCCETELHNLCVTRWEPWGTEENRAVVACAFLLQDGVTMCERMLCYGLERRTYCQPGGEALDRQ